MTTQNTQRITVEATVNAPIETVWKCWTEPKHITQWNNASDDWHTPHAENDLRVGGKFLSRMESRDGSMGFDFVGTYQEVIEYKMIAYTMEDGRKVEITFVSEDGKTTQVTETFDPENENTLELQKTGWQAILNNFKNYVEQQK
jgi:uncharacterized protein YndB with AHSA1/START domain